jgi:hypothetical protein
MGDDENIYSEEVREDLVDDDEMSSQEEAFMKGYDDAEDEEDGSKEDNQSV